MADDLGSTGIDTDDVDKFERRCGFWAAVIFTALVAFATGNEIGSPSATTLAYKGLYERSVCESKGLQVGTLDKITVCLNPETKAVYKIELPTVKKDK